MKQQNRYFTEDLQTKDAIMREAIIVQALDDIREQRDFLF